MLFKEEKQVCIKLWALEEQQIQKQQITTDQTTNKIQTNNMKQTKKTNKPKPLQSTQQTQAKPRLLRYFQETLWPPS